MSQAAPELDRLEAEHGWRYRESLVERDAVWHAERGRARLSYPDAIRSALAEIEDSSYWFRHRNRAIARVADRAAVTGAVWEIGAGNGAVAAYLQQDGRAVVVVEPDPQGAAVAALRGVGTVIVGRLEALGLPEASLTAVGLFDVLEHLAEPNQFLDEVARVLAPGGVLLVTVPAYPWLWSRADVDAGHQRRYTRRSLDAEVTRHGHRRISSQYLFHCLVPAILVGRVAPCRLGRYRDPSLEHTMTQLRPRNRLLAAAAAGVFAGEYVLDARWPLPFGTTVLAAYERE
jgi:SAM-dependent methyltransferase